MIPLDRGRRDGFTKSHRQMQRNKTGLETGKEKGLEHVLRGPEDNGTTDWGIRSPRNSFASIAIPVAYGIDAISAIHRVLESIVAKRYQG